MLGKVSKKRPLYATMTSTMPTPQHWPRQPRCTQFENTNPMLRVLYYVTSHVHCALPLLVCQLLRSPSCFGPSEKLESLLVTFGGIDRYEGIEVNPFPRRDASPPGAAAVNIRIRCHCSPGTIAKHLINSSSSLQPEKAAG